MIELTDLEMSSLKWLGQGRVKIECSAVCNEPDLEAMTFSCPNETVEFLKGSCRASAWDV